MNILRKSLYLSKPYFNLAKFNFTTDPFKAKEYGEEKQFINKEEKDILKKLIKKIRAEVEVDHEKNEINDLMNILAKHKVKTNDELIKALRYWKDQHH